ncbi:MAG: DNA repair exonuclease SbcCD ATPase subunit [Paracoccaceae bacterium]|jgi:DNA repair exonuclease SbcCD ATPase subunit
MATTVARKQHIKVRETQLEIPSDRPAFTEDFEEKLSVAQAQLETLQSQRRELERQKMALEDLNHRKQEFLNGQLDLSEKFSTAVTTIERELFEMKQEIDDLDQTRAAFVNHLNRIEGLNPEAWPKDSLGTELQKSLSVLDKAEDEYEQAVSYFTGTRKSSIFGGASQSIGSHAQGAEFHTMLRNGLAFNLPVIVLGSFALLIYLFK